MQNFDNKLSKAQNSLNNIRGIFDSNDIESKLLLIEKKIIRK